MAYSVDILYTKNEDFSNPHTVTEAGKPSSIDLENLESNQTYYTKAVLKNDGVVEDEDTYTFTTLPLNTVKIKSTDPSDTAVEVELEYTVDGGFYEGFVSCWGENQDPDTDPSLIHWAFSNGADIVNCNNLTAGTTYKFRADIVLGDMTTEIHSSVVTVTTEAGVETECFYVKNVSDRTGTFTISSDVVANNIQYYVPSTNNWMWVTTVPKNISVASGEKLYLRGGSSQTVVSGNDTQHFTMDVDHEIGGDIRSLLNWQDFQTNRRGVSSVTAIPNNAFRSLFYRDTRLTSASDMIFGNVTVGDGSLRSMFYNTSLRSAPDMSGITSVGSAGCRLMFMGCDLLTTPADMPRLTSITTESCYRMYRETGVTRVADMRNVSQLGQACCGEMYMSCTSLTSTTNYPIINSITTWNTHAGMFYGCTSLVNPPDTSTITKLDDGTFNAFLQGCTSLTTGCDLRRVTSIRGVTKNMYNGCSSLTIIYAPNISAWDETKFQNWVLDVAASGTMYKPSALTIPTSSSGVPTGWTTQDY